MEAQREAFFSQSSIRDEFLFLLSSDYLPIEVKGLGLMNLSDSEVTSAHVIEALNQNVEINSGILTLLKNSLRLE